MELRKQPRNIASLVAISCIRNIEIFELLEKSSQLRTTQLLVAILLKSVLDFFYSFNQQFLGPSIDRIPSKFIHD
jgi:hypothetical protein